MDVGQASASIDALIERRAGERNSANAEEMAWKASVRKHNARIRRENRAAWFAHFSKLADSLRASAEEFERRAAELLEDEAPKGEA